MILYATDIVFLCNNVDELAEIVNIYDRKFARFGLKIAASKTETRVATGFLQKNSSIIQYFYGLPWCLPSGAGFAGSI